MLTVTAAPSSSTSTHARAASPAVPADVVQGLARCGGQRAGRGIGQQHGAGRTGHSHPRVAEWPEQAAQVQQPVPGLPCRRAGHQRPKRALLLAGQPGQFGRLATQLPSFSGYIRNGRFRYGRLLSRTASSGGAASGSPS